MDATTNYGGSPPTASILSTVPESESNKSIGEIITGFEVDVACICEKLTNLNALSMHVETKESDFEASVSNMDPDLVNRAFEYALLSGYLDSEVKFIEACIPDLQVEKDKVIESILSVIRAGQAITGLVDMLRDSEKSMELLLEQVLAIKTRAANFEDHIESSNSIDQVELNEKMKMNVRTVESPRDVLRMLDKSLKREIDLEKRVSELTQIEEALTMRLRLLEHETVYAKEEAETSFEKFYEKNHTSELLMETCKSLVSEIKMLRFNLEGSIQRESQLKRELLKLEERFKEESASESTEGIMEMLKTIEYLRAQVIESEDRFRELKDANEKSVSLETELSDVKVKLQDAETCYEAIAEEKNTLLSAIINMNNVIEELKNQVTQGKVQNENMENSYSLLFEKNSHLKNELSSVKSKVKSLETSLHQMKETEDAFAENVNLCSKFISDLVKQMTLERGRLQNQISSLKQENKILVNRLKKTDFATENKEALSTNFEVEKSCNETVTDSTETARDINARQLKTKDILLVIFILVIPLLGVLLYQAQVKHIL